MSLTMVTVMVLRWSGITDRLTASCGRRSAVEGLTPRGAAEPAMDSSMSPASQSSCTVGLVICKEHSVVMQQGWQQSVLHSDSMHQTRITVLAFHRRMPETQCQHP